MQNAYDNFVIIYYSGTGNSKKVSEWLNEQASESGMRTHIAAFNKFDPADVSDFSSKTLVGFFSATHGFNLPHSFIKFLLRFSLFKGTDIFIGNTRAGMKLGKLFLPGLSGIALYLAAIFMWLKGYRVKALYPVDLPSNWISLHPGLKPKVIDSMVDHYKKLVHGFGEKVFSGKRTYLRALVLFPLDILVAPIAVAYYFVGRFVLAKTFVANFNCDNCGICYTQCPTKSIVVKDGRPYWKFTCESCMHCMNYCPKRAIETAHSFVLIIILLLSLLLKPFVNEWLDVLFKQYNITGISELIRTVIQWAVTVGGFGIGYALLHYLMRFPFVSKLVTYTTFTYWRFWRRYHIPGVRRK